MQAFKAADPNTVEYLEELMEEQRFKLQDAEALRPFIPPGIHTREWTGDIFY